MFLLRYGVPGQGEYKDSNQALFFSSDFKGKTLFPMSFPGNYAKWRNGTSYGRSIHGKVPKDLLPETIEQLVYGVDGYIADRTYRSLKRKTFFGNPPSDTARINLATEPYMYWTSEALSSTMVALAIQRASHIC